MLKIAFLLIGPTAFRPFGRVISALGLCVIAAAGLTAWDALDGIARFSHQLFGSLFLAIALFHLLAVMNAPDRGELVQRLWRMGLPLAVAAALLAPPSLHGDWGASVVMAVALVIDGIIRLGIALVVRVPGWPRNIVVALAQLGGAGGLLWQWPLDPAGNVILALSLSLLLSGWVLLRLGVHLGRLDDKTSILRSSLYSTRNWHAHAPSLEGSDPPRSAEQQPLIMYNWMPSAAPNVTMRLPVIDRYFAVPDADGGMSSGHVSLELGADFYISYYPNEEIERSSTNFINTMSGEPSHDMVGSFVPSFAFEVDDWRAPNRQFLLRRFSERRLRAYWDSFRQDTTYSLVNRNCAVAVGPGLEAAMEGVWAGPRPWLRLLRLMVDPGLWLAALIRGRADFLTWTPGFVVDYMGELNRVLDQCEQGLGLRAAWPYAPGMVGQDFPPIGDEA
ncbi:protease [Magnetospirillum sulfuroxidans]|uniref:Protease n=1 Tax=Magnetospirillum sulfuroxidans TaxID=611300 RepID=A0ABS5IIM1_9PROT|nr:protease [Magnetospirillum sulfuroxidans]MBR9973548.1 protease [Magnetospirillum sulfuroxidans]